MALLTSTEGLRQPAFFLLFGVAAALTALSPTFAVFDLGEDVKMVTDLGLSTVLAFSTLLALVTASSTVADEIEGRTALTMLSKPLRREEFLIGKYLGVVCTSTALVLLMSVILLVTLRYEKYDVSQDPHFGTGIKLAVALGLAVFGFFMVRRLIFSGRVSMVLAFWLAYWTAGAFLLIYMIFKTPHAKIVEDLYFSNNSAIDWDWRILAGILFIGLHACVISAFAVASATRLTLVQSFIGTGTFFIIGHASGALIALFRDSKNELSLLGKAVRTVVPDLDQFNITDALATSYLDKTVAIPWDIVCTSALYAFLYTVALLAFGNALFARRELG